MWIFSSSCCLEPVALYRWPIFQSRSWLMLLWIGCGAVNSPFTTSPSGFPKSNDPLTASLVCTLGVPQSPAALRCHSPTVYFFLSLHDTFEFITGFPYARWCVSFSFFTIPPVSEWRTLIFMIFIIWYLNVNDLITFHSGSELSSKV